MPMALMPICIACNFPSKWPDTDSTLTTAYLNLY